MQSGAKKMERCNNRAPRVSSQPFWFFEICSTHDRDQNSPSAISFREASEVFKTIYYLRLSWTGEWWGQKARASLPNAYERRCLVESIWYVVSKGEKNLQVTSRYCAPRVAALLQRICPAKTTPKSLLLYTGIHSRWEEILRRLTM